MAVAATKNNFEEVTKGPVTVVDFWADWCGPCKMMEPVLEQLELEYGSRIKFVKLDVDQNQALAEKYKVLSIPSLVIFKNGVAKEKVSGVFPKDKLARYFDQKISGLND